MEEHQCFPRQGECRLWGTGKGTLNLNLLEGNSISILNSSLCKSIHMVNRVGIPLRVNLSTKQSLPFGQQQVKQQQSSCEKLTYFTDKEHSVRKHTALPSVTPAVWCARLQNKVLYSRNLQAHYMKAPSQTFTR